MKPVSVLPVSVPESPVDPLESDANESKVVPESTPAGTESGDEPPESTGPVGVVMPPESPESTPVPGVVVVVVVVVVVGVVVVGVVVVDVVDVVAVVGVPVSIGSSLSNRSQPDRLNIRISPKRTMRHHSKNILTLTIANVYLDRLSRCAKMQENQVPFAP